MWKLGLVGLLALEVYSAKLKFNLDTVENGTSSTQLFVNSTEMSVPESPSNSSESQRKRVKLDFFPWDNNDDFPLPINLSTFCHVLIATGVANKFVLGFTLN